VLATSADCGGDSTDCDFVADCLDHIEAGPIHALLLPAERLDFSQSPFKTPPRHGAKF
jgi:hypothetical protein